MNNVTSQQQHQQLILAHNVSQNTNGAMKSDMASPDNNSSIMGATPNRAGINLLHLLNTNTFMEYNYTFWFGE